jgi:hypothetical protein
VITQLVLGAPGLYRVPDQPLRALTGVRLDVCAFVGVAPRGPARVPIYDAEWAPRPCNDGGTSTHSIAIAVDSWNAYRQLYGAFEGPGLLPYAVASFFENGGQRAYVVRVVHEYVGADVAKNAQGIARAAFDLLPSAGGGPVGLRASNEGAWGNGLTAQLSFATIPLALAADAFTPTGIRYPAGINLVSGATLRIALGGGVRVIRRLALVMEDWDPATGARLGFATFDAPTAVAGASAELVEGVLQVDDGDGRTESHDHLGLSSPHPRWIAQVLVNESSLIYPEDDPSASWLDLDLDPDVSLPAYTTSPFSGGADRYRDIVPDDFFDPDWVLGDDCPGRGIHAVVGIEDLSLLAAPDLYSPRPLVPIESIVDEGPLAGAEFAECVALPAPVPQAPAPEDLDGLRLDPATDLEAIVALQQKVVELADDLRSFIVLLDVPPLLSQNRVLYWRAKFGSPFAAAYHPWIEVARLDDRRNAIVRVNPSAIAAGIIAQREIQLGVQFGPANVIAASVVGVEDQVSPRRHDELHQSALNVFMKERDGIRLTAARTLSIDQTWRQLNVRRLVTMLERVLYQQMQWAVFELNNRQLRAQISQMLEAYLRQLFRANAFAGPTEATSFFVRCDDALNPPQIADQGQLLAEVGVAPAEPLEFVVLQISRDADATLRVGS